MKTALYLIAVAVAAATFASPAEARRANRNGVNFGTSVRVLDTNERTHAGKGSDRNTKFTSNSQAINPYLGYAFDDLNLGLTFSAENKDTATEEALADGTMITNRNSHLSSRGLSLFVRYNFGGVFFFEGAGGIYEERLKVVSETKHNIGGGEFTGERDEYEVRGVGPGYHAAGGIELQMGAGFYFTAAYQVRMVQLRDLEKGAELGAKRSQTQKREILFGIAHYAK